MSEEINPKDMLDNAIKACKFGGEKNRKEALLVLEELSAHSNNDIADEAKYLVANDKLAKYSNKNIDFSGAEVFLEELAIKEYRDSQLLYLFCLLGEDYKLDPLGEKDYNYGELRNNKKLREKVINLLISASQGKNYEVASVAYFELGKLYYDGKYGIDKNKDEAIKFLKLASEKRQRCLASEKRQHYGAIKLLEDIESVEKKDEKKKKFSIKFKFFQ